jgi:hypothetical protein
MSPHLITISIGSEDPENHQTVLVHIGEIAAEMQAKMSRYWYLKQPQGKRLHF